MLISGFVGCVWLRLLVPRANGHQSIHAHSTITFVFQEDAVPKSTITSAFQGYTFTRASMPRSRITLAFQGYTVTRESMHIVA